MPTDVPTAESDIVERMTRAIDPGVPPDVSPESVASEAAEQEDVSGEQEIQAEEAEPVAELEHLGKKYTVPESLKTAFEANRTQANRIPVEVAEMRKLLTVERQGVEMQRAFNESAKPEFDELARLEFEIGYYKKIDASDFNTDQIVRWRSKIDELNDRKLEVEQGLQGKQNFFMQKLQETSRQVTAHGNEYLRKVIPNWSETEAAEVAKYARVKGFTQDEVAQMYDPRAVEVLWEAAQYRKIKSSHTQAANKVKDLAPPIKPGSMDASKTIANSNANKARMALRKTGNVDAAAAVILQRLRKG